MISKLIVAILALIAGVVVGMFLPGVGRIPTADAPGRPDGVPMSAKWAGGVDGGAWIDCSESGGRHFTCRVYANVTGVLIEDGQFSVNAEDLRPTFYSAGLIDASFRLNRVKAQ